MQVLICIPENKKGLQKSLTAPIETATADDILVSTIEANNVVWNFRVFNNFKVTKKLNLSLFAMYRGEEKGLQITRKPMFMVNTGLRYSFLEDNRATFSFNYSDIFNTMKFKFEGDKPFPQKDNLTGKVILGILVYHTDLAAENIELYNVKTEIIMKNPVVADFYKTI